MKILGICNLYPPYVMGGNELRFRDIIEGLSERHETSVLSSEYSGAYGKHGTEELTHIERRLRHVIPYPQPMRALRFSLAYEWNTARYNYAIARECIARFQPDVVYMSDCKRCYLGAPLAAQDAGVPIVWDITDTSLLHYLRRQSIRRFFPLLNIKRLSFEHSICISGYIRSRLVQAGLLGKEAMAINQGITLDAFPARQPLRVGELPRRLLCVASLIPDKGVHIVIEAMAQLCQHDPRYQLSICGDSGDEAYKQRLRQRVKQHGLDKNVLFLGRVPSCEIARLSQEHHAFIFSSIWPEPFASTPLEAMACRLPVVGTLVGGQADFFEHGINSLCYEKDDPSELAAKIRLLDDKALYERIATRALEQVRRQHSFPDYVQRIESQLRAACGLVHSS